MTHSSRENIQYNHIKKTIVDVAFTVDDLESTVEGLEFTVKGLQVESIYPLFITAAHNIYQCMQGYRVESGVYWCVHI
jgi:hypothetical protein